MKKINIHQVSFFLSPSLSPHKWNISSPTHFDHQKSSLIHISKCPVLSIFLSFSLYKMTYYFSHIYKFVVSLEIASRFMRTIFRYYFWPRNMRSGGVTTTFLLIKNKSNKVDFERRKITSIFRTQKWTRFHKLQAACRFLQRKIMCWFLAQNRFVRFIIDLD